MGKYRSRTQEKPTIDRNAVNPYMRGIGCLFMLIVPVFSYGVGYYLADQHFGIQILPPEWYGYMPTPPFVSQLSGQVRSLFGKITVIPHLIATLVLALVVLVIVGGILSIIYGYMYSIMAPSRYGPTDVPAPRIKTKKYKR